MLRSRDLGKEETFESFATLYAAKRYRLPLLALLVRFFAPERGITLESASEAPAGAGISGSSALMISVASALNKLTGRKYTLEKIREIVQNVEAQVIRVPTGAQDYYPAMYGGVSAIEFGPAGIVRSELPVDADGTRPAFRAGIYGRAAQLRHQQLGSDESATSTGTNPFIAISIASRQSPSRCGRRVERNDWDEAGRLMREEWTARKKKRPGHHHAADRSAGLRGAPARGKHGRESLRRGRRRMRRVSGRAGREGKSVSRRSRRPAPRCSTPRSRGTGRAGALSAPMNAVDPNKRDPFRPLLGAGLFAFGYYVLLNLIATVAQFLGGTWLPMTIPPLVAASIRARSRWRSSNRAV